MLSRCVQCQRELNLATWWGQRSLLPLCSTCQAGVLPYDVPTCQGCGRTSPRQPLCMDCQAWRDQYGWVLPNRCLYQYNDWMRSYMEQYKFKGDYYQRRIFMTVYTKAVRKCHAQIIVPIPVTEATWQTRGFNQVLGWYQGNYQSLLRLKMRDKVAQSSKTRQQRLATPQPFELSRTVDLTGKRILLLDDIYTTGRTLYHAAQCLRTAGAREIFSLTLAG